MSDADDPGSESQTSESAANAPDSAFPLASDIPTPAAVCGADDASGYVVWYRKHLRLGDQRALARAVADGDAVCPLFVFDPAFYSEGGLACDARVRFLHEAVTSLNRLWATTPARSINRTAARSADRLAESTPLDPRSAGRTAGRSETIESLTQPDTPGVSIGYGDPVELLSRFVDRGWSILTMAAPTSRYGARRDDRVRTVCGDAVEFVSGDGLVRDREWSRADWQTRIEEWLTASQHAPAWDDQTVRVTIDTDITPALVDDGFDITPTKTQVPTGTHRAATTRLREFLDRIRSYPGNISAPQDARGGTSGLSPYLNLGLLSIRQVHQYVTDNAPSCRGRRMFISRLVWNMHYNQKLADWSGWTERAVNPVFEGRNEKHHDPALVEAWKQGRTGFPMVDAAMRCLRRTGWLNFRMRAMGASFFTHILHQPWWIGADWYHHHLIDSDVGINYTQWQSQAGLIGKPSQRVYNPRKQVRDHDPEGTWITRWVPELDPLPSQFLDRPERTPLVTQRECDVIIGEDYPRPVVDFEARRESFWAQYERHRPAAARQLRRPEIATRASLSGGYSAARAIAERHGEDPDAAGEQLSFSDLASDEPNASDESDTPTADESHGSPDKRTAADLAADEAPADDDGPATVPTGAGRSAGEPSPDDRTAVPERLQAADDPAESGEDVGTEDDGITDDDVRGDTARDDDTRDGGTDDDNKGSEQTTMSNFE